MNGRKDGCGLSGDVDAGENRGGLGNTGESLRKEVWGQVIEVKETKLNKDQNLAKYPELRFISGSLPVFKILFSLSPK